MRNSVAEFESTTDLRGANGVRYRLSSLLTLVVCAMTPMGHESITATAEWCQRAAPEELAAFGLPYHPLLGHYRVPSEKTLRSVLGRLDLAELSAAGFAYRTYMLSDERATPSPLMPDSGQEREQRQAHPDAPQADPVRRRRRALAVDGKCLRGARRPDGSRVVVLSSFHHGDGITLASREFQVSWRRRPSRTTREHRLVPHNPRRWQSLHRGEAAQVLHRPQQHPPRGRRAPSTLPRKLLLGTPVQAAAVVTRVTTRTNMQARMVGYLEEDQNLSVADAEVDSAGRLVCFGH